MNPQFESSTQVAVQALREGYQPLAIRDGDKRPYGTSWTHTRWTSEEDVREHFDQVSQQGASGIGLLLGEPSGGLLDIDLDHPLTLRLRDYFLPPSAMETGRAGRPRSHRWYMVDDLEYLPSTRRYKMPDGSVSIELRSTGSQTVIPHTIHPSGERYLWEGEPWGGEVGPARVDGRKLAIQVALLAMAAVLMEKWPKRGGRHEAYLHLAGGLLRHGDGIHPYWERNLPVLIAGLADATHDDDGPETRVSEVMGSTLSKLREGTPVSGFPKLGEVIGEEHAELTRRMAREVESLSGFTPEVLRDHEATSAAPSTPQEASRAEQDAGHIIHHEDDSGASQGHPGLPPEERDPLGERISSWAAVDLEPYLSGQVTMPEPNVLRRTDGRAMFYPGRVNSLYGMSESAKSWLALYACMQEMSLGERVMYLDLEDEPAGTLARMKAMGAGDDDIKMQFRYVHPEGPLAFMQRYRFGYAPTDEGKMSESIFRTLLQEYDPTLIVVDGMTVLYGLHGHDTNEATATDVITSWLKSLTRGGRSTVVVIDHTGKSGGAGASPIGAHHKVAMVQGSAIRADAIDRPMPGGLGLVNLVVFKDRPGAVRAHSTKQKEQVAAEVTIDSREEGVTRIEVKPPNGMNVVIGDTPEMDQKLSSLAKAEDHKELVLTLFEGDPEKRVRTRDVVDATELSTSEVYDVWKLLENDGSVVKEGSTKARRYRLNT